MAMNVKFLRGVIADLPDTPDVDTLYFCTDGALYLGSNKIAEVNQTDATGVNNLITSAIQALDADKTGAGDYVQVQVVETDGKITNVAVDETELKTILNSLNSAIQGKEASGTAATLIAALDANISSTTPVTGKGLQVTVEQTDGKITSVSVSGNYDQSYDAKGAADSALAEAKTYADNVKAAILGEGISETFDTLVEIQEWIENSGVDATELSTAIAAETAAREAKDSELTTRIDNQDVILAKVDIEGTSIATAISNAKDFAVATANTYTNTACQNALTQVENGYVAKETGKGLSTNDYTTSEKSKLTDIEANAQVNVLEGVQFNGTDLTITNKKVNVQAATAEQGAKADTAIQSGSFAGVAMTKSGTALSITQTDARTALGLGTAAYKADTAFDVAGAAAAVQGSTANTIKDCVDAINEMNNLTGTTIGQVNDIVSQLTWGTF